MGLNIIINESYSLTPGEKTVLNKVKKAYIDYAFDAFLYVQQNLIENKRPDFILVDSKKGITVLEVKDWGTEYIISMNEKSIKAINGEFENPIKQTKNYYRLIKKALNKDNDVFDFFDDNKAISAKSIFVNLKEEDINKYNLKEYLYFDKNIGVITKDELRKIDRPESFFNIPKQSVNISPKMMSKIRTCLFRELSVINSSGEIISALDYEQEKFARKIPNGHYMLTGIPGSGKTVILLARAITLLKDHPNWKIRVLTYTNALAKNLKNRLDNIEKIEIETANELGVKNTIDFSNIIVSTVDSFIGTSIYEHNIKGNTYENKIKSFLRHKIKENSKFDALLIDEYQDLDKDKINACIKLCKKDEDGQKNILFAGDRLQSIYGKNEINWNKDFGLDMRGRSKLLKTSYRVGKYSMELALRFLMTNEELASECKKFYEYGDNHEDIKCNGVKNKGIYFDNMKSLYSKIEEIINSNKFYYSDIMILSQKNVDCYEILNNMPYSLKSNTCVVNSDDPYDNNKIKICTVASSKGLEAKNVFFCNLDDYKNSLDCIKRMKSVYVALTRASDYIFIHFNKNCNKKDTYVNTLAHLMDTM